jgi:hypothetical protein
MKGYIISDKSESESGNDSEDRIQMEGQIMQKDISVQHLYIVRTVHLPLRATYYNVSIHLRPMQMHGAKYHEQQFIITKCVQ